MLESQSLSRKLSRFRQYLKRCYRASLVLTKLSEHLTHLNILYCTCKSVSGSFRLSANCVKVCAGINLNTWKIKLTIFGYDLKHLSVHIYLEWNDNSFSFLNYVNTVGWFLCNLFLILTIAYNLAVCSTCPYLECFPAHACKRRVICLENWIHFVWPVNSIFGGNWHYIFLICIFWVYFPSINFEVVTVCLPKNVPITESTVW